MGLIMSNEMKANLKTVLQWFGIAGAIVTLGAGFTKSYFTTPLKLEEHDREIIKLQKITEATTAELRLQRDILYEIRGDIKVLNRNNPRRTDQ